MTLYEVDSKIADIITRNLDDEAKRTGKSIDDVHAEGRILHSYACGMGYYGLVNDYDYDCEAFFESMYGERLDFKFLCYEEYRDLYLVAYVNDDGNKFFSLCRYDETIDIMLPVIEFPCDCDEGGMFFDLYHNLVDLHKSYRDRILREYHKDGDNQ